MSLQIALLLQVARKLQNSLYSMRNLTSDFVLSAYESTILPWNPWAFSLFCQLQINTCSVPTHYKKNNGCLLLDGCAETKYSEMH